MFQQSQVRTLLNQRLKLGFVLTPWLGVASKDLISRQTLTKQSAGTTGVLQSTPGGRGLYYVSASAYAQYIPSSAFIPGTADFAVGLSGAFQRVASKSLHPLSSFTNSIGTTQWRFEPNSPDDSATTQGALCFLTYDGASTIVGATGAFADGEYCNFLFVRRGTTHELWKNGSLFATATGTVRNITTAPTIGFGSGANYVNTSGGTRTLAYGINGPVDAGLASSLSANPWQIFQSPPIDIWVPSAGVGAQNLTPSLIPNTNSFYTATVATGAVSLTPGLLTNSNSFYSPTVSLASGPQTLLPSLFSNSNSFYSASVTTGSVDLTSLLFTNSNSFYSPTVSLGGVALLPSLFSNTNSFYAPTISPGLVNLVASLFTNSSTFYGHTVAQPSLQNLTPSLYSNTQAFYTHSISAGTTLSSADLLAIADAVWAHPEALTVAKFLGLK